MPRAERTRRPDDDQLDLTSLLAPDARPEPASADPSVDTSAVTAAHDGPSRSATESAAELEVCAQQQLRQVSASLENTLGDRDEAAWANSDYGWIRNLAAARKGRVAERLVASHLAAHGTIVTPARGPGHSFTIAETRVKVRCSLRWAGGEFKFQQVTHGEFDLLCLLGIEPNRAHAWVLTPKDLIDRIDPTLGWLSFPATAPPAWMAVHGPRICDLPARLTAHAAPPAGPTLLP